jgi:hypothetical protein
MDTLSELARCEAAAEDLRREQAQLPEVIAAAEAGIAAAQSSAAQARQAFAETESARRTKEGELSDTESRRSKFRSQAPMVRTNTEYTTLLHEIDQATVRISELETEILEAMDRSESARAALKTIEVEHAGRVAEHTKTAATARARLAEVERELAGLEAEREAARELLTPDARGHYDHVQRVRRVGTAWIAGRSCARCHRDVPYETINRVRAGEVHACGNCGRILVLKSA